MKCSVPQAGPEVPWSRLCSCIDAEAQQARGCSGDDRLPRVYGVADAPLQVVSILHGLSRGIEGGVGVVQAGGRCASGAACDECGTPDTPDTATSWASTGWEIRALRMAFNDCRPPLPLQSSTASPLSIPSFPHSRTHPVCHGRPPALDPPRRALPTSPPRAPHHHSRHISHLRRHSHLLHLRAPPRGTQAADDDMGQQHCDSLRPEQHLDIHLLVKTARPSIPNSI